MNKKIERGQATREQLIAVATRLFAEHGYEGTPIEAVLEASGVSRGALYHHFRDKVALFEAVLEAVEIATAQQTVDATREAGDAVAALRAGCLAWVRLAGDPIVQRILLIDAPSVVGWQRWREVEEKHALGLLKAGLQAAAEAGHVPQAHVDAFAHMLLAALNETALLIARAPDQAAAMRKGQAAVDEFLRRLVGAAAKGSKSSARPKTRRPARA